MCHSLGKRCVNAFINLFRHWMIYSMSLDIGWCKGSSHIQSSSSISPFLSPCLVSSRPTSHVLSDPCSYHFHSIPTPSCLSSSLVLIFISCLFSPCLHRVPPLVYYLRFSSHLSLYLPLSLLVSSLLVSLHVSCNLTSLLQSPSLLSSQLSRFLLSSPPFSLSPLLSLLFCLSSSMLLFSLMSLLSMVCWTHVDGNPLLFNFSIFECSSVCSWSIRACHTHLHIHTCGPQLRCSIALMNKSSDFHSSLSFCAIPRSGVVVESWHKGMIAFLIALICLKALST